MLLMTDASVNLKAGRENKDIDLHIRGFGAVALNGPALIRVACGLGANEGSTVLSTACDRAHSVVKGEK